MTAFWSKSSRPWSYLITVFGSLYFNIMCTCQGYKYGSFVNPKCVRSFQSVGQTLEGIEDMHMMMRGQVKRLDNKDSAEQAKFIRGLSRVAA